MTNRNLAPVVLRFMMMKEMKVSRHLRSFLLLFRIPRQKADATTDGADVFQRNQCIFHVMMDKKIVTSIAGNNYYFSRRDGRVLNAEIVLAYNSKFYCINSPKVP